MPTSRVSSVASDKLAERVDRIEAKNNAQPEAYHPTLAHASHTNNMMFACPPASTKYVVPRGVAMIGRGYRVMANGRYCLLSPRDIAGHRCASASK